MLPLQDCVLREQGATGVDTRAGWEVHQIQCNLPKGLPSKIGLGGKALVMPPVLQMSLEALPVLQGGGRTSRWLLILMRAFSSSTW